MRRGTSRLGLWICVVWALALASIGEAQAQVASAWAVADQRRILDGSEEREMSAVSLFGMRGETLVVQLVVHAGPKGAKGLTLAIRGLEGVRTRVFEQRDVVVSERSHGLVWKPGSDAEPDVALGGIPDRMVPRNEPFDLAPGQSVRLWVDLWVRPTARSGTLRGEIAISSEDGCDGVCAAPVTLELLDRTMPEEPHAKTMVWFSGSDVDERVVGRYFAEPHSVERKALEELRRRHYQLAREHRISLFGQHEGIDEELHSLLTGAAFREEAGYEGPGQGKGLDVLALHAYGGELTPESAQQLVNATQNYPDLRDFFVYVMDEPEAADYPEINRRVRASKPMPSLVTTLYTPALETDIFALLAGLYSRANAADGARAGKHIWIYNGERPFTGSFAIDDVASSLRVNPWIQYKHAIPRWFYWEATYYHDFQGKRGAIDVAKVALNFTNRHGDRVNGDGLLMYPGRDLLFPDSDAGIDGPLPSVRLKQWRRGIEDVEYLVMAREAGFSAEVDALLEKLVPSVLGDRRSGDAVGFAEDAAIWHEARRYLFELLRDGESSVALEFEAPPPRRSSWPWPWAVAGGVLALLAATAIARRRR